MLKLRLILLLFLGALQLKLYLKKICSKMSAWFLKKSVHVVRLFTLRLKMSDKIEIEKMHNFLPIYSLHRSATTIFSRLH